MAPAGPPFPPRKPLPKRCYLPPSGSAAKGRRVSSSAVAEKGKEKRRKQPIKEVTAAIPHMTPVMTGDCKTEVTR